MSRLVSSSARKEWSLEQLEIGLSHLLCWRLCCNSKLPMVVLEDDVVLANNWYMRLKECSRAKQ